MNAIGKPCCACRASWQPEAPLFHFFSIPPLQHKPSGEHEFHTHTSIDKTISDPSLPAAGLRSASRSTSARPQLFFSFVTSLSDRPFQVNKVLHFLSLTLSENPSMRIMGLSEGRVPASHGSEKGVRRSYLQSILARGAPPACTRGRRLSHLTRHYTYPYGTDGHTSMQTASLLRHLITLPQSLCGHGYNSRCSRVSESLSIATLPLTLKRRTTVELLATTIACDDAFHS
ncbi:hypothetical protein V8E52_007514 [Russula decolorans]